MPFGMHTIPQEQIVATKHAQGGGCLSGCTQEPIIKHNEEASLPAGCARPIQLSGMAVCLLSGLSLPPRCLLLAWSFSHIPDTSHRADPKLQVAESQFHIN